MGQRGKSKSSVGNYIMYAPRCEHYLPVTKENLPTGEISSVLETPFDFRQPKKIQEGSSFEEYDNFFVISKSAELDGPVQHAVTFLVPQDDESAIQLEVYTNQPGFQLYTANAFDGSGVGSFEKYGSIAVEPSGFIDAPNHINFPSVELQPGMTRRQVTQYRIGRKPGREAVNAQENSHT